MQRKWIAGRSSGVAHATHFVNWKICGCVVICDRNHSWTRAGAVDCGVCSTDQVQRPVLAEQEWNEAGGRAEGRGGEGRTGQCSSVGCASRHSHTSANGAVSNCACETARAQQDGMAQERNGRRSNPAPFPARVQHTRLFDIGAQSHRLFFESADESPIVLDQALLLVQLPHDIILAGHILNTQPAPLASLPPRLKSRPHLPRSRLGPTPSPPTTEATLPHSHIEGIRSPTDADCAGL